MFLYMNIYWCDSYRSHVWKKNLETFIKSHPELRHIPRQMINSQSLKLCVESEFRVSLQRDEERNEWKNAKNDDDYDYRAYRGHSISIAFCVTCNEPHTHTHTR